MQAVKTKLPSPAAAENGGALTADFIFLPA